MRSSSAWWLCACLGASLVATPAVAASTKPISEKVGGRVSRGVIHEGLSALDEQENRDRLVRIVGSPQMRAVLHDLTASIVLGVFEGVRQARSTSDKTIGQAASASIDRDVVSTIGRITYRVVDSAMSAALTSKHAEQIEVLGKGTTHAVVRGLALGLEQDLGPSLATAIDKDIGPAVAIMISRDIMPAVGRGLDTPEMQSAITNLTRSVATGLVEGAGIAMDDKTEQNEAEGKESSLQLFGDKVAFGYAIALFFAFAFATILIVLTVALVRGSQRQRRQAEQAAEREAVLAKLVEAIESDHPDLKTDMRRLLQGHVAGHDANGPMMPPR